MPMRERTRPRLKGADLIVNLSGGSVPVDRTIGFVQTRSFGGKFAILNFADDRFPVPVLEHFDGLVNWFDAELGQPRFNFFGCFFRSDFGFCEGQARPTIQFGSHVNDCDAGSFVAVVDAPVDGCRAAIFRKQRSVQVDPTKLGGTQACARQNLSVIANHKQVRVERFQLINELVIVGALRIKNLNPSSFAGVPRWILRCFSTLT